MQWHPLLAGARLVRLRPMQLDGLLRRAGLFCYMPSLRPYRHSSIVLFISIESISYRQYEREGMHRYLLMGFAGEFFNRL